MTLATLFFLATLTLPVGPGAWQQTPVASAPSNGAERQEGSSTEQKQSSAPSAQSSKGATSRSNSNAKRRRYKKKAAKPDCVSATPAANTAGVPPADPSTAQTGAQQSGTQTSTNCPPPKIVVQQGGIKEQSIQLAGGPNPDQSTQKRDAVNQLLEATDHNLKKTAGLQLSSEQQDTVSQARQFVEQSKTALAAGDLERARTLAWKAQVLSEDLVKPQK
jgi:hypothetical protein